MYQHADFYYTGRLSTIGSRDKDSGEPGILECKEPTFL